MVLMQVMQYIRGGNTLEHSFQYMSRIGRQWSIQQLGQTSLSHQSMGDRVQVYLWLSGSLKAMTLHGTTAANWPDDNTLSQPGIV